MFIEFDDNDEYVYRVLAAVAEEALIGGDVDAFHTVSAVADVLCDEFDGFLSSDVVGDILVEVLDEFGLAPGP